MSRREGPSKGALRRGLDGLLGRAPDGETEDEIRFHLEMRVRDYVEGGMSEDEARAAAAARMGDLDAARRACGRVAVRERGRARLSETLQDARYALRTLPRARSFTLVSVATLAVGIGATTAIFSLVHAVLLAPLPYAEPDRLVRVWERSPQGAERNVVSSGNVVDWKARAESFSVLGAHRHPFDQTLTGDGEAVRVTVADVEPALLGALGVPPLVGRGFDAGDAETGGVAVLSHGTWQTRYGGDRNVVGRSVVLGAVSFTVVGVMPPGFVFPREGVDVWRPLTRRALDPDERRSHNFLVVGRLAPGATLEGARAEMGTIAAGLALEHPAFMTGWGANVVPFHDDLTREVRPLLLTLLAGVAVVLLIACGNLASLLLARAVTRRREMAIRGALGAGRGRILRQLFTESLLLGGLGGAAGLLLAPVLLDALVAAAPAGVPFLERASVDGRILAFGAAVTLGCAVLFGLAPAATLSRADLDGVLRGARDASGGGHTRLRAALLVGQVALSVVLLIGAGLFVRSFAALQSTDPGFEPAGLATMAVALPSARYGDLGQQNAFFERLVEGVRALPGVVRVAGSTQSPGSGTGMTFSFAIEGREATNASGREDDEELSAVTPGYFEMLGQRVLEGRGIDARDREDAPPVVVINESLARKHWPRTSPVGERIAFRVGETPWREIVGVVEDIRMAGSDQAPVPTLYIPHAQRTWPWMTWMSVVARVPAGSDPAALAGDLGAVLRALDADLPPEHLGTVEASFRRNLAPRTFAMTLVTGFGAVALLLSVVGLYGLLSYTVARQRHEIGIRMALGAERGAVVRRVIVRSLALTAAGAALGVTAAAGASRVLESLLWGVSTLDPATYAATVLLVAAVALATAALPAIRAARTDPLLALRSE